MNKSFIDNNLLILLERHHMVLILCQSYQQTGKTVLLFFGLQMHKRVLNENLLPLKLHEIK